MGGHYRYDESAKRWYVSVYWQKKKYKIWRYNGEPMAEQTAAKLVNAIRKEVDDGTFDPRAYLNNSPLGLKVYSETWLNGSANCANSKRLHRSAIKKAISVVDEDGKPILGEDCDIRTITFSKMSILYNTMDGSAPWRKAVITALKAMLHYAHKDGVLKKLPMFPVLAQVQTKPPEYLTYEDQQKVIAAIPDRHRAIFRFGMECGLRIGELRALRKDCIEDGQVVVKRSFSRGELRESTKTYMLRRIPLTTTALEILKGAPVSFSDFIFTWNGRKPYSEPKLYTTWRKACQEVGITIKQKNAIRHSLGCQLLDDGCELELVRDIYGHTSTNMTRVYARRTPQRMLDALEHRGRVISLLPESCPNLGVSKC